MLKPGNRACCGAKPHPHILCLCWGMLWSGLVSRGAGHHDSSLRQISTAEWHMLCIAVWRLLKKLFDMMKRVCT